MRPRGMTLVVAGLSLLTASASEAQRVSLARFLPTQVATGARLDLSADPADTRGHFVVGAERSAVVAELNRALALQVTLFPLNAGWSGFGRLGPAGTPPEGPGWGVGSVFAERAETGGRGRFRVSFTQQYATYEALDGVGLRGSDINLYFEHDDCCPEGQGAPGATTDLTPEFERDLLVETLSIDLDRNVFTVFADYGVTDRLDVGLALPIVKVNAQAHVTSRVLRTATAAARSVHQFDIIELANRTTYGRGYAAGLGDLVVRAKVNALRRPGHALAGTLAVAFPTGDPDDLLGTGATRTTAGALWSGEFGRAAAQAGAAFTWAAGEAGPDLLRGAGTMPGVAPPPLSLRIPNELSVTGGGHVAVHPRVMLGGEVLVRRLDRMTRFAVGRVSFPSRAPGALPTAAFTAADHLLVTGEQPLTLAVGVAGLRVRVADAWLLRGDVLFPLNDAGLQIRVGALAGVLYAF